MIDKGVPVFLLRALGKVVAIDFNLTDRIKLVPFFQSRNTITDISKRGSSLCKIAGPPIEADSSDIAFHGIYWFKIAILFRSIHYFVVSNCVSACAISKFIIASS